MILLIHTIGQQDFCHLSSGRILQQQGRTMPSTCHLSTRAYTDVLLHLSGGVWHEGPCDPIACLSASVWARCVVCPMRCHASLIPGKQQHNNDEWESMWYTLRCHKLQHPEHHVQLWYGTSPQRSMSVLAGHVGFRQQLFAHLGVMVPSKPVEPPPRL